MKCLKKLMDDEAFLRKQVSEDSQQDLALESNLK